MELPPNLKEKTNSVHREYYAECSGAPVLYKADLQERVPIKFYYGCSDIPTMLYQVFYTGDTLGFFYDEIRLTGSSSYRDLRVKIPGSDYRFNLVRYRFHTCSGFINVSYCANHDSKVSSFADEIGQHIDDNDEVTRNFLRDFILTGVEIINYDKEVKKYGLRQFLQTNMLQDYSNGNVKQAKVHIKRSQHN
jgi:hypothetical protein